jgi:four helix bundle protein
MNDSDTFLEHERLDVYRAALAFDTLASKAWPKRGHRELRQQLDRATIGIVLCIAEGAGRRSGPDKRRFYEMARGSALESAAVFDILRGRGLVSPDSHAEGRVLLVRIVQMLTRMSGAPRESGSGTHPR